MKQYLRVRIDAPEGDRKEFHGEHGEVVQSIGGGAGGKYVIVEMERNGKRYEFKESQVRGAFPIRLKKGARVKVRHGAHKGEVGTVGVSFSKNGQARCWVALDGKGGGETGFARAQLEIVKVARGQVSLPDPEGKNVARSRRAGKTLKFYYPLSGAGGLNVPTGETVADLLCDLAHWADRNGEDFGAMLLSASSNYSAETGGRGLQMSKFIMC